MVATSVIICCANAADTLEQACKSVAWADELVIVDSGSTDGTAEIAQRYADQYVQEPWRGYAGQKVFATGLCKHDWIFILDSDEECSPELAAEWQAYTEEQLEAVDLLLVPRRNWVMGKPARAWWPDRLTRIFHRDRVTHGSEALHDTREASDPSRVRKMRGWLEHKRQSAAGFSDYFSGKRTDERLLMVAWEMYERGKRAHWWDLVFRPWLAFWKFYLVKRGILDGTFGLLIAQKAAVSAQLKYAALWAVQHGQAPKSPPDK